MRTFVTLCLCLVVAKTAAQQKAEVTVAGDPQQCESAISVQLWTITYLTIGPPGPAETVMIKSDLFGGDYVPARVTFVDGLSVTGGSCRWTFKEVPAGEYVTLLTTSRGSGGSEVFRVFGGESPTITVPPPLVALSASMTRNGVPATGVIVRVAPLRYPRPAVVAVSDKAGNFSVTLDRLGAYDILADGRSVSPWTLTEGENRIQIELPRR